MTTLREIAANRQNSLKSTGPRTEQGKAVVSRNAGRVADGNKTSICNTIGVLILQVEGDVGTVAQIPGQDRRNEDSFSPDEIPERAAVYVFEVEPIEE